MRTIFTIVLLILLPHPAVMSQTSEDILKPLLGQKLILLHLGDLMGAKIKKDNLAKVKGDCNVAVVVREASFDKGRARLRLEDIGMPTLSGVQNHCKQVRDEFSLEISGFKPDDTSEPVVASVHQLLRTPEQYLADNGIAYDFPPAPEGENAVKLAPGTTSPKNLLTVDAVYSEEGRREKYQGTVVFQIVIGSDGRIHQAKIARGIGHGLDENALRTLSMWRFEPAKKSGQPVACATNMEVSFHLY
jgi:TonB family protein